MEEEEEEEVDYIPSSTVYVWHKIVRVHVVPFGRGTLTAN